MKCLFTTYLIIYVFSSWATKDYGCLNNRKYFKNYCYKFYEIIVNFSEAEKHCKNEGDNGHLVSIYNLQENRFVQTIIEDNIIWIGGVKEPDQPFWKWNHNNESINYTQWHENQRNNPVEPRNCIYISYYSGKWWKVSCAGIFPFVCKSDTVCSTNDFDKNVIITITKENNVSTAIFSCPKNFTLSGPETLTCSIGSYWNISEMNNPICNVVKCLDNMVDIKKQLKMEINGNVLNFSCEESFQLQGPKSATCLPIGKWNISEQTDCVSKYADFSIESGIITICILILLVTSLFLGYIFLRIMKKREEALIAATVQEAHLAAAQRQLEERAKQAAQQTQLSSKLHSKKTASRSSKLSAKKKDSKSGQNKLPVDVIESRRPH